jgi:hypothetical protein
MSASIAFSLARPTHLQVIPVSAISGFCKPAIYQYRRNKETEEQKCRRKLRHADFLSALMQARSLAEDHIEIYAGPFYLRVSVQACSAS